MSRVVKQHEVRMRERGGRCPSGDPCLRGCTVSRDEFDGGFLRLISRKFREEHTAAFRATQPLQKSESIDDAPNPIPANCRCVHCAHHSIRNSEAASRAISAVSLARSKKAMTCEHDVQISGHVSACKTRLRLKCPAAHHEHDIGNSSGRKTRLPQPGRSAQKLT